MIDYQECPQGIIQMSLENKNRNNSCSITHETKVSYVSHTGVNGRAFITPLQAEHVLQKQLQAC